MVTGNEKIGPGEEYLSKVAGRCVKYTGLKQVAKSGWGG